MFPRYHPHCIFLSGFPGENAHSFILNAYHGSAYLISCSDLMFSRPAPECSPLYVSSMLMLSVGDIGEVAFVILRKSEGLVQCVYEEGSVDFPLKDLKEESAVAVTGTVKKEDRAPGGVEVRLQTITVLSEPTEPMTLAVNKWKMNTSLEAMLNMRPIALRNVRERAKFRIQEGVVRAFRDFLHSSLKMFAPPSAPFAPIFGVWISVNPWE